MKDNDFDLVNLPEAAQDPEIKKEDFTLQQADKEIHEQKFQNKPTTFLKDSLKRFRKNKSSVVAAYILGILILLSIFVPIFSPWDVSKGADDISYNYLEPKLFDSGTGFWDGTSKKTHVPVDPSTGYPDTNYYRKGGISNLVLTGEEYTTDINKFGKEGYLQIGYYGSYGIQRSTIETIELDSVTETGVKPILNLNNTTLTLTKFETVDSDKIVKYHDLDQTSPKLPKSILPENFVLGETWLEFSFIEEGTGDTVTIPLTSKKVLHNTGTTLSGYEDVNPINISQVIIDNTTQRTFTDFYFTIVVEAPEGTESTLSVCSLYKSFVIKTGGSPTANEKLYFEGGKYVKNIGNVPYSFVFTGISFEDATQMLLQESKVKASDLLIQNICYWSVADLQRYLRGLYMGRCGYCSFTYDSYAGAFGVRERILVSGNKLEEYAELGLIDFNIDLIPNPSTGSLVINTATYRAPEILSTYCPVLEKNILDKDDDSGIIWTTSDIVIKQSSKEYSIYCTVMYYRYIAKDPRTATMPKFLFGTDKSGKDMFKYVFDGLRNSLLLGVLTFAVCFLFGLLWGAVSGYFGGTVDLIMERLTDILSGIPWIVVMTIVILHMGQNFGTFALALCLTGWIGTASTTRTQFYRFRGREYVLASRTLGASDARLIAKHILPNAMGTIITGAVLMIPSVIFSEATISYLGLGFKSMSSLGVILSNNQSELLLNPYLLIFPSVVIALVMISFNLFGNGLRDAINPSLKGEDE